MAKVCLTDDFEQKNSKFDNFDFSYLLEEGLKTILNMVPFDF